MPTAIHLATLIAAVAMLTGCGAARTPAFKPFTDPASGRSLQFYTLQDASIRNYGLQEAGPSGAVIAKPQWSDVRHNGVVAMARGPSGGWGRVQADGTLGSERFGDVRIIGGCWLLLDGPRAVLRNRELGDDPPADLVAIAADTNTMLASAAHWTPANLGNLGTQDNIRNRKEPLDLLQPHIEALPHAPVQKSRFYETYAQVWNLAVSTFYHTKSMSHTERCFGSYADAAMRVRDAWSDAIRHLDPADRNREARLRVARLNATIAVLAADARVAKPKLDTVLADANADLEALEARLDNASTAERMTAELQKQLAKYGK